MRGAFANPGITVLGTSRAARMHEGGEWGREICTDFCSEQNIHLQFQGKGAHPWLPERRNGLSRGIYLRPAADGRFFDWAKLDDVHVRVPC